MVKEYEIIIIGSGFGGIGLGMNFQKSGIENYVILERESEMGGTWWRNTYPGAAVDVQSHLYSFKSEPYNWSRLFALQPEILDYTNYLIYKYDLKKRTHCNKNVVKAEFDEDKCEWVVFIEDGSVYKAPILINSSGSLSQPSIPPIKGKENFKGRSFHTSRWDHSFDYTNKKVAVIGTGASSVQVVPAIASKVKDLYVFQRTPHWILPRPDRKLSKPEQKFIHILPIITNFYRELMYWKLEARMLAFKGNMMIIKYFQRTAEKFLKKSIPDSELRKKLTPDFILGCKRVLLSNDYFSTLLRENVNLETDGIDQINENGLLTKTGNQIDVDLIVYATGFFASENNIPYPVIGRNKLSIQDSWKDGAHAYLGTVVPSFPNFFILVGPNTGIGHTSALHIMESQIAYLMEAISAMRQNKWKTIEIKEDVEYEYNDKIQKQLSKTVWQTGGCKSWYQNESGRNTTLYPNYSFVFRKAASKFKMQDHLIGLS
jgi:cation diffusion facilitator CzcD-associated flavoprotein CzcO